MLDKVFEDIRVRMDKLTGLFQDLQQVQDAACDLRDADEDSPWVLRYLNSETQCAAMLSGKAEFICKLMAEKLKELEAYIRASLENPYEVPTIND